MASRSTSTTLRQQQQQRSKHDRENKNVNVQTASDKTPHADEKVQVVARSSTFVFAATELNNFSIFNGFLVEPNCTLWLLFFYTTIFVCGYLLTLGNRMATWIATITSLALCFVRLSDDTYITLVFGFLASKAFIRTLGVALASDGDTFFHRKSPFYMYQFMLSFDDIRQNRLLSKHLHKPTILTQLWKLAFHVCAFVCASLALGFLNVGVLSKGQALTRMSTWPVPLSSDSLGDSIFVLASTLTNEYYTLTILAKYLLGFFRFFYGFISVGNLYQIHTIVLTGCEPSPPFINVFESEELNDLWSKRWNLPVRNCLASAFYSPLKRAGFPTHGKACTFLASGVYHMYPLYRTGVSSRNVACMGMFFVLQIPLIALESWFGMSGKVWFWSSIWLAAPLFLEPVAELFGDY